ncbi:hypothetical protein QE152_g14329 [Popillia japonica]|uniref:Uncharacterized protein n=1 Tax=Popillia japonica TaxID=7064 RepID=A0AAW1L9S7_POPJA
MDYLGGFEYVGIKEEETELIFESDHILGTQSLKSLVEFSSREDEAAEDVKPILEIKEEPNDEFIDDSVKVEEACVTDTQLESSDQALSQEIESALYCHQYTMIERGTPDRAFKTLPSKLLRLELGENRGVFAKRLIPIGVTFGPFEGLKDIKIDNGRYYFTVRNRQIVPTESYENSNWLQFIGYDSTFETTNLVMIQSGGQLFYRTRVAIDRGERLLVQVADYTENMVYFDPIDIGIIGGVHPCVMCCLGFRLKIHLEMHLKKCLYSGISMFNEAPPQETEPVYLNKSALYCYQCMESYLDFCPKCPMLTYILDTMIKRGTPDRAFKTLPSKLLRLELGENGGVFAKRLIPIGVTFGPFEGLKDIKILNGRYYFPVRNRQIIPTESYENSNWLQFIGYDSTFVTTNLVMIKSGGELFYRTRVAINEGERLLIQVADYTENMVYFDPISIGIIGGVHPCLMCCLGFRLRIYLQMHLKKCPYPGISMFNILEENSRIELSPPDVHSYKCRICSRKFNDLINFKQHSNRAHSIMDDKQLNQCFFTEVSNNTSDLTSMRCDVCKETFTNKQLLSQHIQMHIDSIIPSERLRCAECRKMFTKKKQYKTHMLLHKLVKKKKAPQLKRLKSFPKKKELDRHPVEPSKKKKPAKVLYKCNYCDFQSTKKCIDFVQHMLHKYDKADTTT